MYRIQPNLMFLCNLSQSDGHTIASAFYHMELLQKINEMLLLTQSSKKSVRLICPNLTFLMRNENEYSLYVNKMIVESVVAEDIPLCSFEKNTEDDRRKKLKKDIYNGFIRSNLDTQFIMQKEKK